MKIGSMNTKIILQKKTQTKDENNAPTISWSTFVEVWANKNDFTGGEYWDSQQTSTDVTGEFEARYQQSIYDNRNDLRVKEKATGNIYIIESIIDPTSNRESLLIRGNRNE